jgi:RNA polymerase sigma-70 factor (TIGR02943 family)
VSDTSDFAAQVEALRPQLLRFARSQLRNDAWAEDAVSETLLAALEKPHSFAGRSQLKTWLVAVLKHKVIDQLRRHAREATVLTTDDGEDLDESLFDDSSRGHWREMPPDWGSPEAHLGQRQFFEVLEACMDHLPPTQGRVFMMREWLELSTDEICKELQITATNLWVLLHRARLRLRECLQQRWFSSTKPA